MKFEQSMISKYPYFQLFKNQKHLFLILLISFCTILINCRQKQTHSDTSDNKKRKTEVVNKKANHSEDARDNLTISHQFIPAKIYTVRDFVRKNGQAINGYAGGRKFKNLERRLPQKDSKFNKISYQEWDVNKKIIGRNRGKERLITGSDGKDYYTNDHYQSFIPLRKL